MRIALIAPPWVQVPPVAYGGTEAVIDRLAVGFLEAGHEVLLVATGDSTCPVPRHATFPEAQPARVRDLVPELLHVAAAYDAVRGFDVVHDHTYFGPLYRGREPDQLVVTTAHMQLDGEMGQVYERISQHVPLISISDTQRASAPHIVVARVIHHGIDLDSYPLGEGDGGYVAFLARLAPEKGAHHAVDAAKLAGVPLRIAGTVNDSVEHEYFEEHIQPRLDHDVVYVGEVDHERKVELLGGACALLFPIEWDEPFGVAMIEALACGTPVLAFARGAATEIVENGKTGFLCRESGELAEAISRVEEIERAVCRASVAERFSDRKMVHEHLDLFGELVRTRGKRSHRMDMRSVNENAGEQS